MCFLRGTMCLLRGTLYLLKKARRISAIAQIPEQNQPQNECPGEFRADLRSVVEGASRPPQRFSNQPEFRQDTHFAESCESKLETLVTHGHHSSSDNTDWFYVLLCQMSHLRAQKRSGDESCRLKLQPRDRGEAPISKLQFQPATRIRAPFSNPKAVMSI